MQNLQFKLKYYYFLLLFPLSFFICLKKKPTTTKGIIKNDEGEMNKEEIRKKNKKKKEREREREKTPVCIPPCNLKFFNEQKSTVFFV